VRLGLSSEFPLRAARAEEGHLRRLVVGEVRGPALLVRWQPEGVALGAVRNDRNALSAHEPSLGRWGSQRRRADCPIGIWAISGRVALPKPQRNETEGPGRGKRPRRAARRPALPRFHATASTSVDATALKGFRRG
jgi:hypothetical protein